MHSKSNALLKFGVPILLLVGLVMGLRACNSSSDDQTSVADNDDSHKTRHLTEDERNALGVEADSPEDTVSTLVAQMQQMRSQLAESQQQSEKLRDQNERLAGQNRNVDGAINNALSKQQRRDERQRKSLVGSLNSKIDRLRSALGDNTSGNDNNNDEDMPVGLGLDGQTPDAAQGGLSWVNPLGVSAAGSGQANDNDSSGNGGSAFSTAFESGKQAAQSAGDRADRVMPGNRNKAAEGTPVYTVPKNSTLVGSVAMSALLGRVPINGTVTDPYPFKVIIGPKNLTANGIQLPELKGAIVSGTATGDWTLSCVRGKVKSITFVFQDGTTRTVPKSDEPGETSNSDSDANNIGYLSNPQGVPCVSGTRKTNARSFIMTNLLLSAGAAAANATAGGETQTSVSGLGTTTGVTGNVGKYIAGSAASSGLNEVRKFMQERFGQTFDAVYVPPGQPVAVNIDKQLPIDYEHQGRKVHYAHPSRANGLD
jgi:integrating conjugative element protein (TIGR03752 family)